MNSRPYMAGFGQAPAGVAPCSCSRQQVLKQGRPQASETAVEQGDGAGKSISSQVFGCNMAKGVSAWHGGCVAGPGLGV